MNIPKLIKPFLYFVRNKCRSFVNRKNIPILTYILLFRIESLILRKGSLDIFNKDTYFKIVERQRNSDLSWSFPSSNKRRGWLYSAGLLYRGKDLANTYEINKIRLDEGDIIIDCGANFGDFWLYLKALDIQLTYFGVEPGHEEFKVLERNLKFNTSKISSNCIEKALSDKTCRSIFHYSPDGADSSLIKPKNHSSTYEVSCITLDDLLLDFKLTDKKIKLLKLEAEGFEPEIIEGARSSLPNIQYIAADLGPERGINEDNTIAEVTNILLKNGFSIDNCHLLYKRATLIFRNNNFN